ncbi:MAG: glycosyltransferase family 39 protein [Pyrinomonadaceae bacterium]
MATETETVETTTAEGGEQRLDVMWLAISGLVIAAATFLRFYWLTLKPLHHDEGVNGFFLTNLFRDGVYKYDPANYHGPTLYYISLGFVELFGLNTTTVRASVAIFGVLMVALTLYLRRYIGDKGTFYAALFLSLSPGMVFISRYFIHEIFFVFLSLGVAYSVAAFISKTKAGPAAVAWLAIILLVCFLPSALTLASKIGSENETALWAFRIGFFLVEAVLVFVIVRMLLNWNGGRPIYILLAAACAALMFATKETAFITLGTMLIAVGCVAVWLRIRKTANAPVDHADKIDDEELRSGNFRAALGSGSDRVLLFAAAAALSVYLLVLFFSSFFTYWEGVKGAIDAYAIWTRTGSKDHTQNGIWAYVTWGMKLEAPILILGAAGIVVAFIKARHRFAMFTGLWGFGLFAAYTIIPYKTPWLALSFLLPLAIMAGYAIGQGMSSKLSEVRYAAMAVSVLAAAVLAYQSYELNFVRYDDDRMPYVYAHTRREFHDLVEQIDHYADKSGKGRDAVIDIVSPDYWPMVWYLRDYSHANFYGRMIETSDAEMIVAKKDDQDADVVRRYSAKYFYVGSWPLRPGVELMLLVKKEIADAADATELYRIRER